MTARWITADVFDGLATLEDGSVDVIITSPPFLALRSYLPADHPDKSKEIGSEATPAEFIDTLLAVTAELRRVLAPHGSICVELGDTYSGSTMTGGDDRGNERYPTGVPMTRCISCGRLPTETCCDICHRVARAVARLAYAIGYDETGDEMTELFEDEINTEAINQ